MTTDPIDYKKLLLQLIGSLTLADHMGDAADDMWQSWAAFSWDDGCTAYWWTPAKREAETP